MEQNNKDNNERVIYTYDPEAIRPKRKNKKKGSGVKKGIAIIAIILVIVVGAGAFLEHTDFTSTFSFGKENSASDYEYDENYIGVLQLHGTIGENNEVYNQKWMLERIQQMKKDDNNKGMIISINSPGGAVYESDELYFAIKDYRSTGKPVYSYMESMAASGGYYICAPCNKIIANRNCWTGSIGVTIGTVYDISELLEKAGIKTVTITSGKNKAMGSSVNPLTKEQKEIYQSLVDEAYEQFVEIVAEGRNMKISQVKKIADGRVYTAKQAKKLRLIDGIGSFDNAVSDMKESCGLENCSVKSISYQAPFSWRSALNILADMGKSNAEGEYDSLRALMDENSKFTVTYMAEIKK